MLIFFRPCFLCFLYMLLKPTDPCRPCAYNFWIVKVQIKFYYFLIVTPLYHNDFMLSIVFLYFFGIFLVFFVSTPVKPVENFLIFWYFLGSFWEYHEARSDDEATPKNIKNRFEFFCFSFETGETPQFLLKVTPTCGGGKWGVTYITYITYITPSLYIFTPVIML